MPKVLIPGPICLPQTAALRGLGRRGDVCDVAWSGDTWRRRLHQKFYSRFCRRVIPVPDLEKDPEAFSEAIIDLCSTGTYDVVLPVHGRSLEALLDYRQRLSDVTGTLMPTPVQFAAGFDKMRTVSICREFGIAHPASVFLSDDSSAEEIAETIGFPVIVKHRQNFGGSKGVRVVAEPSRLLPAIQDLMPHSNSIEDIMIQQCLPGTLFDACVVAKEGRVAGLVTQARRLMYPVSGGVGCILATVELPRLAEIASSIVKRLRWTGPAQLEFKWDPELETFSLIEINPRFWGTTGAWLRAGANFPALAVDLAMGLEVGHFRSLPPDLRFNYVCGRTPLAMIQLWRARGLAALRDPISYTRTWYDMDISDPLPDLWRLTNTLTGTIGGRRSLVDTSLPAELIPSFDEPKVS